MGKIVYRCVSLLFLLSPCSSRSPSCLSFFSLFSIRRLIPVSVCMRDVLLVFFCSVFKVHMLLYAEHPQFLTGQYEPLSELPIKFPPLIHGVYRLVKPL